MNAAARVFNQGVLSRGWVISVFLTRAQLRMAMLMATALVSALSLVYVINASRGYNSAIQQTLAERNHLHVQWGQLLLEKGSLAMEARVQNIAEGQLDMVVPDNKSVVVVDEQS